MVSVNNVSTLSGVLPLRATSSLIELLPTSMTAIISELGMVQSKPPATAGSSLGHG